MLAYKIIIRMIKMRHEKKAEDMNFIYETYCALCLFIFCDEKFRPSSIVFFEEVETHDVFM